jgi:hypothetical protein
MRMDTGFEGVPSRFRYVRLRTSLLGTLGTASALGKERHGR